ncbi:MAG: LON peptidase substrate-binding domain-containing protein [Planctomycetota bacterium]|jgi:Lon protease-like protein
MSQTVRVNFSKPLPLFPLPGAVLLPHAVQPLHVYEPRYRQMVEDSLDQSGQIAMACFAGSDWKHEYHGCPSLRPAVCIGQIVNHERLADGRLNLLLHGVCRAVIKEMIEPDEDRMYRMARLLPLEALDAEPPPMEHVRGRLHRILTRPRLGMMRSVEPVLEWFRREDVPTHALIELVGFTLVHDPELKYCLLAEADPLERATIVSRELCRLDRLLGLAELQNYRDWPKGMSWN